MRLMFHFTEKRIGTYICICFIAYKIAKNIEMILDKVLKITKIVHCLSQDIVRE